MRNQKSSENNWGSSKFKPTSSKPNPDDRSDNVEKISENIKNANSNIELANEMIARTSSEKNKQELRDKNTRRKSAIEGLKRELKDEQDYQNSQK